MLPRKYDAISLKRSVEYYQWVEHENQKTEDKLGGKQETTYTYTYDTKWVDSPVNSKDFKDPDYKGKNVVLANVEDGEEWAENVTFGAYTLNQSLIHTHLRVKEPSPRASTTQPSSLELIFAMLVSVPFLLRALNTRLLSVASSG